VYIGHIITLRNSFKEVMNLFKLSHQLLIGVSKYLKSVTLHDLTSWFIFLISVLGIITIILAATGRTVATFSNALPSLILWVTAISVFMYTRETRDLKLVTQKQLEETRHATSLSVRPFIRLQWSKVSSYDSNDKDGLHHIKIINEGAGSAIKLNVSFSHIDKKFDSTIIAGQRTYLPLTEPNYKDFGYQDESSFLKELSPQQKTYDLTVKYQDILGKEYQQTFKSNPQLTDGFEIITW
jgi:hypothetical protein